MMMDKSDKCRVYIGSDHAGFDMKVDLHKYLEEQGFDVVDLGCFSPDSCDYPDIAREVGEKVLENGSAKGMLLCGSGVGMAMAANKLRGIRATVVTDEHMAEMSRRHNDANVISFGARETDYEVVKRSALKFLTTDFEADQERHVRRVKKMDEIGITDGV